MTRLSSERWLALGPHLDHAFDLGQTERVAWLASLRADDAPLAAEIEGLLERHRSLDERQFLARGLVRRPRASLEGQVVGAYRLIERIGQGGMGSVWRAERCDGQFRGEAAVKLLNSSLAGTDGESRFRREASILARLQHPHIAHLVDAGVSPLGQPYLVLEHVRGERIDAHCDARRLDVAARIGLFLDVLSAVAHAHANLVVHRDLKPSNVLVDQDGRVKLLDFGIAKLVSGDGDTTTEVTRDGEAMLTPAYAAPEQLTGGPVTTATDVYALGALLYLLLTGRHPVCEQGQSPAELIRGIVDVEPCRPSDAATAGASAAGRAEGRATTPRRLRGALRGDLDNIIAKALRKRPADRYATVEALADDLRRSLAHEPVSARPDSIRYRAGRFLRRHRMAALAGALLIVSLAGGLAASAWQGARARSAAERAEHATEFVVGLFELSSLGRPQSEKVTARELLDQGVRRLDTDLSGQPELRARLLGVMGRVHASLGLYDQAADLLGRGEALLRHERAGDDPEVARILSELSSVRGSQGDYDRAAALARDALAMQRRIHRGDHADIPLTLDRLGLILKDQGRAAEAEPLLCEALDMRRRLYGSTHREIVTSLNHVAIAAYDRGDYAAAEALQREALQVALALPGETFLEVPWAMAALAASLSKRGANAEAIDLLQEALRQFRARLGDDHPELARFMRNLASALRAEGRHAEATKLLEETLAIERRAYGDRHHEVAKTTHDLATVLHQQGRLAEAEARHRECLAILEALLPPGHPHLGRALSGLATVRADQGDLAEAESLFRRTLAILEARLPAGHDQIAAAQLGLGRVLIGRQRRLAEAQDLLERAADAYRAKFGSADPRTADASARLAECRRALRPRASGRSSTVASIR